MLPTAPMLANEFSQTLRSLLPERDVRRIAARNAGEREPGICHSHDFCDANIVLHEVFLSHGMDVADEGGLDRWAELWDSSWNLAKAAGFRVVTPDQ